MRAPFGSLLLTQPSDGSLRLVGRQYERCFMLSLPAELLTAICAHFDCRTIASCRAVCHRWRNVVDASLQLQYRIELARDGMSESDAPSLQSTAERLARLRELRSAWRALRWTRRVVVPMPGPCCAYELVGGLFCKTQPRARHRNGGEAGLGAEIAALSVWDGWVQADAPPALDGFEFEGGVYEMPRTLSTTWLPAGKEDARTVVRDDVGIPTRDIAIDPSQDLMVLLQGGEEAEGPILPLVPGALELHLRTISTNETHPEARAPALRMPVSSPIVGVFIQIVDDVVGMMYCVESAWPRVAIWNWKTGDLVVVGRLPPGTKDLSFIHSRALLVTTDRDGGALQLFRFTCNGVHDAPTPAHPDPELEPRPTASLVHVATLRLPRVHPSVRVLSIGMHAGPHLARCPPGRPYTAANAERIHVLTIQYVHLPTTLQGPRVRPTACLYVHNRALERFLERGGARTIDSEVPWEAWGPVHARMMLHGGSFQWLRYVHGQRVVMLRPTGEADKSTVRVLDFNVWRVPVIGAEDEDEALGETRLAYAGGPTRIIMPAIFVDVVESELPYREMCRDVPGDYSGMMIDDERLVGVKHPAFLTGDMKEINVFTM